MRLGFKLLISFVFGATTFALAQVQVTSSISRFQLASCNEKVSKCISVEADRAESGSMTPNLMLKNVLVKIKDTKTNKETVYSKSVGFYDIQEQRVLLTELTPQKTLKETVFLIKDVSVRFMEMK